MPQKWALKIKDLGDIPRISEADIRQNSPSPAAPSQAPRGFSRLLHPVGKGAGGGGQPQLGTYLLKGGQEHVAVPGVLCKTQRDGQGSGGGQGHGGSKEKQEALPG